MGNQKHKTGTFIRLALADDSFGCGRLLEPPHVAFYLALNAWELIGWRALEEHLTQPLVQFRQDVGDFRRCTIFDTAGNKRSAEPLECVGLERAAVWEQESVEERLLDAFRGRPNEAVEHLKVRLR
ncbi:MAG TPA: hypothetical protein VF664_07890 [Cystobacter sp.]